MIEVIENKNDTFVILCDTEDEVQQIWTWFLETFPSKKTPEWPDKVGFFNVAREECWPKLGRHVYFYDENAVIAFKLRWM